MEENSKYLDWLDDSLNERESIENDFRDYSESSKPKPKSVREEIVMDVENKVITISASLIKSFLYKGNNRDICPKKLYMKSIKKEWNTTSEAQDKGLFFETLCLGASADGTGTYDLPRKKPKKDQKIGDKTADHIRIEEQALVFNQKYPKYGMIVMKSGEYKNVQKEFCLEWIDPKYKTYEDYKIYIQGTMDLVSPISWNGYEYPMAVIDLKLTKDRNSTFGEFGWGNAGKKNDDGTNADPLDHTQAYLYHLATGLPFFYWLWDYCADDSARGEKIIPVRPFGEDNESKVRLAELHESIRKTVQLVIHYHHEGWPENGNFYSICKDCLGNPLNGGKCQAVNNVNEI